MKRMHNKSGSAILMVLLVTSMASMLIMAAWRMTSLDLEIALQRSIYKQNLYMTQGLLSLGVGFCREYYEDLIKEGRKHSLSVSSWQSQDKNFSGVVTCEPSHDSIAIHAELSHADKIVCSLSCRLARGIDGVNEKNVLALNSWSFDGQKS